MIHQPLPRQNRLVPALVTLLGLALTTLISVRIQEADDKALQADLDADAAQLGLLIQSFGSGIEIDLTSTVEVALVTDGDPEVYRSRAEGFGDRALLSADADLEIVTVSAAEPDEAAAMTAVIDEVITRPDIAERLEELAASGTFGFVPLDQDGMVESLLLAAGASDGERSFVEVRRFELGAAGPMMTELIDGIDSFAVYIGSEPDPADAVIASTIDLPLGGQVAYSTVDVSEQTLLVEVQSSMSGVIPPWAIFAGGLVMSVGVGALLAISQRRRDRAVHALTTARAATEARARLEADLQQTQRMEAVGQLASGIAHDFNNLLAAIISTVELVADEVDDARMLEDLDEIRHAARRGVALTRRLLSFSRRDAEVCEPVDVNEVVGGMRPLLLRSMSEDISLDIDLEATPVPILGDAGEIEQVLLNLVLNARDAAVGPHHEIAVRTRIAGDDLAVLSVRDTGAGMEPDVIAKAFEPFFTTKSTSDGSGLGLAIVYGIAKRMGGDVRIESTLGSGTAVHVSLPLASAEGPSPVRLDLSDRPARTSGGRSVLLVEDVVAAGRSTKLMLEQAGHVVRESEDGIEAVAAVEDGFDPDVLLVDVVLAGALDGRDVARRVRELSGEVQVVFMSREPWDDAGRHPGVDGAAFLQKPFPPRALEDALDGSLVAVGR